MDWTFLVTSASELDPFRRWRDSETTFSHFCHRQHRDDPIGLWLQTFGPKLLSASSGQNRYRPGENESDFQYGDDLRFRR